MIILAVNYLHPGYRDNYIFVVLVSVGLDRLFNCDDKIFASLEDKEIMSPKTYWYFALRKGHSELAMLATKLLKVPALTCPLERLFSNWSETQ